MRNLTRQTTTVMTAMNSVSVGVLICFLVSTVVVFLSAVFFSTAAAADITEQEPNDRPDQAQPVEFPCRISGTFSDWAQKDIYAFTLPAGGLPTLHAELINTNDLNPTLELLDGSGRALTKSDFFKKGQGEYLASLMLEPGEYYLQVNRHGSREQEGLPYTLSVGPAPEVTPEQVKAALNRALDYLISEQGEDGGFPIVKLGIVSAPAFAVQAWLGADCLERDDWEAVYLAIDFIKSYYHNPADYKDDRHGLLQAGTLYGNKLMYEHGIALTALIEAYAYGAGDELAGIIEQGLDFLYRAQLTEERPALINGPIGTDSKYYGGWRYAANAEDADLSVSGWQIIALTAARGAGFEVPQDRLDKALTFVRRCWKEAQGEFAYMPDGQVVTGRNAMGALSMQLLGAGDDDLVQRALRTILTRAPAWEGEPYGEYPFYYWYYGTRAAYLAGGEIWEVWKQATCGMLVRHQNPDGSWALTGKEDRKLDPVYGASLGALILEICCGSPPIYLRTDKAPPRKAPPRNQISVTIEHPVDGARIQGPVEIRAVPEVPQGTTVARVIFSLDGEELGELTAEPWVWEVDLGPGVRPHTFTVTAENNLGKQAGHTVATRAGQDRIGVRIVSPRAGVVLGVRELFVRASDHADSPLDSMIVMVDSVVVYRGSEPEIRIQQDFGTVGGQRIEARAVNALGTAAEDQVVLPEERPLEVDLSATVTDAGNNYILDLEKERFQVREDGISQTIVRFSRELTPVSMAVVMDVSGSIRRHLAGVQQAAGQFVSQIRPEDRVMIIEFSDQARMVQNFTSDVGRLKSVIDKSKARGGTALYDAVVMACNHLKRQQGRTAVILLTDGKDEDAKGTKPGSRHTFQEAVEAARESGVTVYALGLGKGVAVDVLEDLSRKSGGRAYFPPTVEDLREVYGLVAQELRSQYTIGYSSTNRLRDGAWRELEVTVPGTDYTVRTRKGYFAR